MMNDRNEMDEELLKILQQFREGAAAEDVHKMIMEWLGTADAEHVKQFMWNWAFFSIWDAEIMKQCLDIWTQSEPTMDAIRELASRMASCIKVHPEKWTTLVVELVADNNPYKRMVGRQLWDETYGCINADITSMSEETQCKFGVSLLQDLYNPEERLPHAMQLLNSPYESVRTTVSACLLPYMFNYPGLFESSFQHCKLSENKEVKAIANLISENDKKMEYLRKCVEFQSEYMYPVEYEIANRMQRENMEKQFKETAMGEQHTFMANIKHFTLARGGGMRQKDGTCSNMEKVECTVPIPIYAEAMTPYERNQYSIDILKDWSANENESEC